MNNQENTSKSRENSVLSAKNTAFGMARTLNNREVAQVSGGAGVRKPAPKPAPQG